MPVRILRLGRSVIDSVLPIIRNDRQLTNDFCRKFLVHLNIKMIITDLKNGY